MSSVDPIHTSSFLSFTSKEAGTERYQPSDFIQGKWTQTIEKTAITAAFFGGLSITAAGILCLGKIFEGVITFGLALAPAALPIFWAGVGLLAIATALVILRHVYLKHHGQEPESIKFFMGLVTMGFLGSSARGDYLYYRLTNTAPPIPE